MGEALFIAIAIVCAYLIGSIPTAYIVARLKKGVDIRQVGSRNMGTMNVVYQVGFRYGLLVLAVDIGKGAAAVALARWLGVPPLFELLAGAVVLLGHIYTVFLKFHGGRGGATAIGVFVFLMPWGIPFYVAIFGISLALTRNPTLSYSLAFLCFPIIGGLLYRRVDLVAFSVVLLLALLVRYIPRARQMRTSGGSWSHVVRRRNLKDRL